MMLRRVWTSSGISSLKPAETKESPLSISQVLTLPNLITRRDKNGKCKEEQSCESSTFAAKCILAPASIPMFPKGSHTTPASLHGATTTLEADAKSNRECANKSKTAVAIGFEKAWKRKLCWHYERGTCKRTASECAFAHGEEDLRHPAMPALTLSQAMLASTEHLQWSNANKNA